MDIIAVLILRCFAGVAVLAFGSFGIVSAWERERRASMIAFAMAAATGSLLLGASFLPGLGASLVLAIVLAVFGLILGSLLIPFGASVEDGGDPELIHDERDIMFARHRLRPGSESYESYYSMRPENKNGDDHTRSLPGLESPDADKAEPVAFASALASSRVTDALGTMVDGSVAGTQLERSPESMSALVKELTLHFGARTVGIARLEAAHVYSHIGREEEQYGQPVQLDHEFAIAFTVEMDHGIMQAAPEAPVIMESMRQYANAALIAVQIAATLRDLGHAATAHIDKRYRVIAPLVARDAGLGEIGRMGILMTPELGPRVRIGVVTTTAQLIADQPTRDSSVLDFCTICKKCADNCPTQSIPRGDRQPVGPSGSRWKIDSDTCFRYWNVIGTDCGRCMAVCPYSHPDNLMHNLARSLIAHSGAARRAMVLLDDVFYGRQPTPRS